MLYRLEHLSLELTRGLLTFESVERTSIVSELD